ncbi:MAG: hypothetical protein ACK5XN_26635 [Bacteroidota bacterium]
MYTPPIQYPRHVSPNPKWKNTLIWGLIVSILAIIVSFANGCTTAKNAANKAAKIMDKYPEQVLPELRKKAPCITVRLDTVISNIDTVIHIDCPDTSAADYFTIHDTTIRYIRTPTITRRVPVRVQLPGRTIYKYIEDSAKIKELHVKLDRVTSEREAYLKQVLDLNSKLNKARRTRNWLWVILILSVVWKYRRQISNLVLPLKGKV